MDRTLFKHIAPGLVGAVTVATVGIPQAAQAQTIEAESRVSFTNVTFTLNGENFWPELSAQTEATAGLFPPPNLDDFEQEFLTACTNTPIPANAFVSRTSSFASSGANVACNTPVAEANNFAQLALLDTSIPNETSTALGSYETFGEVNLQEGDVLAFNGNLNTLLSVSINGYDDPIGALASSGFLAQLTINDADGNRVFTGTEFDDQLVIQDRNDSQEQRTFVDQLVSETYTVEEDGLYSITFSAVEEANAVEEDSIQVPEPSNLAGFLALGGIAFLLKRRKLIKVL